MPECGHRPIGDLAQADVHSLLDELVAKDKAGTAREVRKHLSRLFNFATARVVDQPLHQRPPEAAPFPVGPDENRVFRAAAL